jgi:hypothetical protein
VLRLGWFDRFTERRIVGWYFAPPEQRELLARDDLSVDVADDLPPVRVLRHEEITDGIFAGGRQFESEFGRLLRKELVRDLYEDAGAVTHSRICADGATMLQVAKYAQPVFDKLMRLATLDVGDEADSAGILVERRIVKTVRARCAGISS